MTKKQVGKRFLQIIIVLFGISFFTFGLTYLSPGDPAEIMLTECGNLPTPELLEQTRHELGLDQPFLVQYGSWLKGVVTGDMGQSYSFKMPVSEQIPGLFCERNYLCGSICSKLLAGPDPSQHLWCSASLDQCCRRQYGF